MNPSQLDVRRYLEFEEAAAGKHEYVGGAVRAMSGGTNRHNLIASNLLVALATRLRPGPCRAYNSDTKIRLRSPDHVRFYYPDVSVICHPNPPDDPFQDRPTLVAEVLSDSTRRLDLSEKKDAYLALPSLTTYLLLETHTPAVILYQRTDSGFLRQTCSGLSATLTLHDPALQLPLSEIYEAAELQA